MRLVVMKVTFYSIIMFFSSLFAQSGDSLLINRDTLNIRDAGSLMNDSSAQIDDTLAAENDSLSQSAPKKRTPPLRLSPEFYDIRGELQDSLQGAVSAVYKFNDILQKNYSDASDALLYEADLQIFNFMEPFRSRYAAPLNLLPHQASVSLDHHLYSDPISGLYGTSYVMLDALANVEISPLLASDGNSGFMQLNSRLLKTREPYTRIMYNQGDWGFTNIDVAFSEQFTNKLLLQFGGSRQVYDGWQWNVGSVNDQYRLQAAYQISKNVYNRFRFQKNDAMKHMFNFSRFSDYRVSDERVDIYNDLTIVTDKEKKSFWRVTAEINTAAKASYFDTMKVIAKFNNYRLGLTRDLLIGDLHVQAGLNGAHSEVWGSGFVGDLPDNTLRGFLSAKWDISDSFYFIPKIIYSHIFNFNGALSASAEMGWRRKGVNASLVCEKESRLAFRNERSFSLYNYQGSGDIDNEDIYSFAASFSWSAEKYLSFSLSAGNRSVVNEIVFDGNRFYNGEKASFRYLSTKIKSELYKFTFIGGAQLSSGEIQLSPRASASLQGQFHTAFFKGALIFDAMGSVFVYGSHQRVMYDPVIDRFYRNADIVDEGYWLLNYKIAATIKDAQLYFAMDNPLSEDYFYIYGYPERFRRIYFGVNWVLWN